MTAIDVRASSPYASPETPTNEKRPENRLGKAAAWCGGAALVCAVIPPVRPATVVLGAAAVLMAVTALITNRSRGRRTDAAWIAIVLAILAAGGMVASQTAFSAVASDESGVTPVSSSSAEEAEALATKAVLDQQAEIKIGKVFTELDPSGITRAVLRASVKNISNQTLSYDFEFVATNRNGKVITRDSAFVPSLEPGKTANVRVFNILNDEMAAKLIKAQFRVTKASSY